MGDIGNSGGVTIVAAIGGLPRRLKRPRDWEVFIQNKELSETDLVRVERQGAEPADMLAVDVPELRHLFEKFFPRPDSDGVAVRTEVEAIDAESTLGTSSTDSNKSAPVTQETVAEAEKLAVQPAVAASTSGVVPPWLVVKPKASAQSAESISSTFSPETTLANRKLLGKILLGVLAAILFIWLLSLIAAVLKPSTRASTDGAPAPQSAQAQAVTVYTTREVGVRPAPTTINTVRLALLPRGTRLDGIWVKSADGQNDWLKISVGVYAGDYVWGGNLSMQYVEPDTPTLSPPNTISTPTDAATLTPTVNPGIGVAAPAGVPTNAAPPAVAAAPAKPSFDCSHANTWAESTVCASPSLAALDILMASAYRTLMRRSQPAARQQAVLSQRAWLQQRALCEQSAVPLTCMDQLYRQRIAVLNSGSLAASFSPVAPETPATENSLDGDTAQSRTRPGSAIVDPCSQPTPPRSIDGTSATQAEMAVAHDEVVAFMRASDVYQTCVLSHARTSDDPRARAIIAANQDLKERVGAAFNSAVLAYKSRN